MKKRIKKDLIEKWILNNNFTITKFCKKCGISRNTFCKIMNGDKTFNLITYFKIAKLLNLGVFEIVEDN